MVAIIGASVFSVVIVLSFLIICGLPLGELTMGGQYKVQSFSEEIKNYFANIFRGYNFTNGWIYSIMVFGQCYKDNLCCYGDISFA